jgi:uncharacterized DUF497 family protein
VELSWDPRKARANVTKHGVTFHEAASVFGDSLAITFLDPDHSEDEYRYLTFGLSQKGRLLVVVHSRDDSETRLISARLMTRRERGIYEEG